MDSSDDDFDDLVLGGRASTQPSAPPDPVQPAAAPGGAAPAPAASSSGGGGPPPSLGSDIQRESVAATTGTDQLLSGHPAALADKQDVSKAASDAASSSKEKDASSEQLFSDSDDTSSVVSAPEHVQEADSGTAQQPPPPLPPPAEQRPSLPSNTGANPEPADDPKTIQREISMQIGNAAILALKNGLGEDDAKNEVLKTVQSLMPQLTEDQARTIAGATVDSVTNRVLAPEEAGDCGGSGGGGDGDGSADGSAALAAAASPLPLPPPPEENHADASSAVRDNASTAQAAAASSPPAAATAASRLSSAQSKSPLIPQTVNRPSVYDLTSETDSKEGETAGATRTTTTKPSKKQQKHRVAFMNKAILAGPELYDQSGKLSISNLRIPPDQVVVVEEGASRVEKIRGVVTGVPRQSKEKDWYDVKWSIKDRNVLQVLDSTIPATPRNRELLKLALGDKGDITSNKVAAQGAATTSTFATSSTAADADASGSKKKVQEDQGTTTSESTDIDMPRKKETEKTKGDESPGVAAAASLDKDDLCDEEKEKGVEVQCHRCKKWRLLPESARNDERPRKWFCELNVYDPSNSICSALETKNSPSSPSSSAGKKVYTGSSSKDSPNEYDEYVMHGRPSQPAATKMTSQQLSTFLFDTQVIPMLIRSGWKISKKARVIDESKAASSDVVVSKNAHKDLLFLPPGVEAKAPFKSRVDYFDSKKGFMNYLQSGICSDDPLAKYALAFLDAAERIVKREKRASKSSAQKEPFDDMASRLNSEADNQAMKALKKAKLTLPPGVRATGSVSVESTSRDDNGYSGSSSSDDDVLATYRSKKSVDKKEKKKSATCMKRPSVPDYSSDSSSSSDKKVPARRWKKSKSKPTSVKRPSLFDDTASSSDGDEKLLLFQRSKNKAKRAEASEKNSSSSSASKRNVAESSTVRRFKGTRMLPKYVEGTSIKVFPSNKIIQESIVLPIIESYCQKSLGRSRVAGSTDAELLEVNITDIANEPNQVRCDTQGIKDLEAEVKARLENWINTDVNCRYRLGQAVEKFFPDYGTFRGRITALPTSDYEYYSVYYPADGDEEDIHVDKISKYVVDEKKTVDSKAPPVAAAPAAVDTDAPSAARSEGKKNFRAKFLPVRKIEYQDSGLNLNTVHKSMWTMHQEVYGVSCDDGCPCPSDMKLLTQTVKADSEAKSKRAVRVKPAGFVGKFAPKFYNKLKKEFPESSPADLLQKLLKMWDCHCDDTRFGTRCRAKCACGEAWKSLFLDECLRPKQQGKIPKKRRPDPSASSSTLTIPKKMRKAESNSAFGSVGVDATMSGTPSIPKKKRTAEPDSSSLSLVPLRPSGESAITQRIKRKERERGDTSTTEQQSLSKGRADAYSRRQDAPPSSAPSTLREYSLSFNAKEPLGFFVITEANKRGSGTVCKIVSVSPDTSKRDARLQPGTIVVGTGTKRTPVASHIELRKRYDETSSNKILLHFINTDVIAPKASLVNPSSAIGTKSKNRDWSSSGVWRGFSRVAGWAGGSKQQQKQEDLEGARQLKQSKTRSMPSVSRYMPRGHPHLYPQGRSPSASFAPSQDRAVAPPENRGSGIGSRAQSGPLKSILRDPQDRADIAVAGQVKGDLSDDDDDKSRPTKVKFVPDENLEQIKHFSQGDKRHMIVHEPHTPAGLKREGNDALSYAVEFQTYEEIIRLLEGGSYVSTCDSEGKFPMDRAKEKFDNLKQEQKNLKTRPISSLVGGEFERVDSAMKDAELKFSIMRLYRDAERVIEMADYVKDWSKVELTIKGVQNLELTPKARVHPSSNYIYCTFTGRDGVVDKRHTSKIPLSRSAVWNDAKPYTIEYNNEWEDLESIDVEVILYKGDPNIAGGNKRLSKWKGSLARIRHYAEKLKKDIKEENEKGGELPKNAYLLNGFLHMGPKILEMDQEMLDRKRLDVSKSLSELLDKIEKVRMELSKLRRGKDGILPGNISIPMLHNLSLLHAAVYATDEIAVKRLLSLGANLNTSSIVGTPSELARFEMKEATESESNPEAVKKFNSIIEILRKAIEDDTAETSQDSLNIEEAATANADEAKSRAEIKERHQTDEKISIKTEASIPPAAKIHPSNVPSEKATLMPTSISSTNSSKRAFSNLPAWMTSSSTSTNGKEGGETKKASSQLESQENQLSLPILSTQHWLPQVTKVPKLCHFNEKGSCHFGKACRNVHIHSEVGPVLDSTRFNPNQRDVDRWAPREFIYTLSEKNGKGDRFFTAAFCCLKKDSIVYYAERGPDSNRSAQGVYWYSNLESSIRAVQSVVYCIVSPEGQSSRKRFRPDAQDGSRADRAGSSAKRQRRASPPGGSNRGSSPTPRSRSLSPVPTQNLSQNASTNAGDAAALPSASASDASPSRVPPVQSTAMTSGKPALKWQAPSSSPKSKLSSIAAAAAAAAAAPKAQSVAAPSLLAAPVDASNNKEAEPTLPDLTKNWLKSDGHVHPPVGAPLDNDAWCKLALTELQGDCSSNYKIKTEMIDDTFELYYTAAFEDPSDNFIYYAERGGGILNKKSGVWWYSSEETAMLAVKRVIAAAQKTKRDAAPLRLLKSTKSAHQVPHKGKPSVIDTSKPAVNDDSSLSNMSIDSSSSAVESRAPQAATDLPILDNKDWIKGKSVRCRYFNSGTGCDRGSQCKWAHVQLPVGQRSLHNADSAKVALISKRFILCKEGLTSSYNLLYTAAYFDPKENVIYYAEGGKSTGKSSQGIWWYTDEEDAVSAVKSVVVASSAIGDKNQRRKEMLATAVTTTLDGSISSDALMRGLAKIPNHNLQPVLQKIFPGAQLHKSCWNFRHDIDGSATVVFNTPRETQAKTKLTVVHPTWRGGTLRGTVWWYKDERTARNAAFMRFLELCAERRILKDARHLWNGTALF